MNRAFSLWEGDHMSLWEGDHKGSPLLCYATAAQARSSMVGAIPCGRPGNNATQLLLKPCLWSPWKLETVPESIGCVLFINKRQGIVVRERPLATYHFVGRRQR